jgi:polysaccharide export outer membrane protein
MVRILICVPSLNRPRLVLETVESLRRQTCADFHVLVSDDGSEPEASASVERRLAEMGDPRIIYHRHPTTCGEYGQGWFFYDRAQDYEFMAVLHDDDLLEPGYVGAALAALDAAPGADVFLANPRLIDAAGQLSPSMTADYLRDHGRNGASEGLYDVRAGHLMSGFTPISGTVLRVAALRASGFVDEDCHGNFPFEFDLFLRLGDRGAKGWFNPEPLLRFRYHDQSMRHGMHLGDNPHVVRTMLKLLGRRRYEGALERRRRVIMSRLLRADGLIRLREGDLAGCRRSLGQAVREHPSPKAIAAAALAWAGPGMLRSRLPPLTLLKIPPPVVRPAAAAMVKTPATAMAALALALALAAPAHRAAATTVRTPLQPEVLRSLQRYNTEYVLAPGDQLDVQVFRVPDLSKTVTVRPDGYVTLPSLKDVQVAGLSVPQATEKLTALYAARLVAPDVTVTVANPREASVFVLGEVARPGPVAFRTAPTAAMALAESGGVVRSASMKGVAVVRLDKDGYLTARVVERGRGGKAGFYASLQQIVLQPNDMIIVPESGRSQFTRFVQDFINTPLGGVNQVLSPYFQFRVLREVERQ